MSDTPRLTAYRILDNIAEKEAFSHIALDDHLSRSSLEGSDRRLVTQIVYGTLTWQRALDLIITQHLDQRLSSLDTEIKLQLRMGVYQIVFLDKIPPHAAVNEAVEATKKLLHRGAGNLVNAVLHSALRHKPIQWWNDDDRDASPASYLGERYSLPNWLANRLIQMYSIDDAENLADAFNQKPPVFLRANRETADQFRISDSPLKKLSSVPHALQASSLTNETRDQVEKGYCTIQDLGSQLIGWLPQIDPGARVLDACAGLGGKTLHLADRVGPEGDVVALDPQEGKLEKLSEAARRANLDGRITTEVARLENFAQTDPSPFDTVVVDAPCTALGTIRRHPEIRWRRSESDLARMTSIQETLLHAGERLVGEGGDLVYAVCSFLVEEGPRQVSSFLERHSEWRKAEPATASVAWESYIDADATLSVNPLEHNTDAFYGARLVRT